VLEEGDGAELCERFSRLLEVPGQCEPVPVVVQSGGPFDTTSLPDRDGALRAAG
jgi:hypothetical protein